MARLVRRLILRNYKSVANCRVDLEDLTLLVGRNGAGKSNIIDALRLIAEALATNPETPIRQRGGINEVRRRSGGHPTHFGIGLRLDLGEGLNGHYALKVGAGPEGSFNIQREDATVSGTGLAPAHFSVQAGTLVAASEDLRQTQPKILPDRLYLTAVSSLPSFRLLFDGLLGMRFSSINPDAVRELQPHNSGLQLNRSGANLAAVIRRLRLDSPETLERMHEYLRAIVPSIQSFAHKEYGPRETLEFRQQVQGSEHPWRFHAENMSDGTLRSLGVLTALFADPAGEHAPARLVAIEEPEITIHPGAANILMDAILEASGDRQVLATSHSPDLLDHPRIPPSAIRAVRNLNGETIVSPLQRAALDAIQTELFTPGELLRQDQLQPHAQRRPSPVKDRDLFAAPA